MSPDEVTAALRAAGCVFAEEEAVLLLEHAGDAPVEPHLARRVAGEPLEQVLGWVAFDGVRVPVAPGVFVPRRRSELLVRLGVEVLPERRGPVVLDLCCGVGALGLALLRRRPDVALHAADLDPAAVRAARVTLAGTQASVHEGDLLAAVPQALRGRLDLVLVNAPYVPTAEVAAMPREAREHEALLALDGGPDGTSVHARVAQDIAPWLAEDGHVVLETSRHQAETSRRLLQDAGLVAQVRHDPGLAATAVLARRVTRR